MNRADWSKRYPLVLNEAAGSRAQQPLTLRWSGLDRTGWLISMPCTAALMNKAQSLALSQKAALRKVLRRARGGIQYVEHTEGDGAEMFEAVCKLGLEGIVSKKLDAPYRPVP
jgi:hypothetical protein